MAVLHRLPVDDDSAGTSWRLAVGEAVVVAGDAATANRIRMCLDAAGITAATVLVTAAATAPLSSAPPSSAPLSSGQFERQGDPVE
ncbi:hypothetical protein O7623_15675 [Solwaraspora sp. WMMD791]|uniref:hypothetical protein n=1 Tax=Solwaraspora sp. WMMD791 TaxID=3016086 RepID=UPI00249BDA0E|nr:hypothetical protein [Solwaraspora sp. WMMD791]WFE24875.1 hypothetical protein O7623_15675 [Solwaraspora sp. WMMD791]